MSKFLIEKTTIYIYVGMALAGDVHLSEGKFRRLESTLNKVNPRKYRWRKKTNIFQKGRTKF